MVLYTGKQMSEFICKMAEYPPVKEDFTKILEVEIDEEDRDAILEAAQKEKDRIGQKVNIYKERTVSKGRGISNKESVFGK